MPMMPDGTDDVERRKRRALAIPKEEAPKTEAPPPPAQAAAADPSTFDQTAKTVQDTANLMASLAQISNTLFPQRAPAQMLMAPPAQGMPLFAPSSGRFSPPPPARMGGGMGGMDLMQLLAMLGQR